MVCIYLVSVCVCECEYALLHFFMMLQLLFCLFFFSFSICCHCAYVWFCTLFFLLMFIPLDTHKLRTLLFQFVMDSSMSFIYTIDLFVEYGSIFFSFFSCTYFSLFSLGLVSSPLEMCHYQFLITRTATHFLSIVFSFVFEQGFVMNKVGHISGTKTVASQVLFARFSFQFPYVCTLYMFAYVYTILSFLQIYRQ